MNAPLTAAVALLAALLAPLARAGDPLDAVPTLPFTVVSKRPHDPTLFTQGMAFHGDLLVESGGNYRASRLLTRSIDSRTPQLSRPLDPAWFAEGVAVLDGHAWLLTWREGIAQRYALPSLQPLERFRYRGEGWGLTTDGTALVQSDGSDTLVWRNPADFREMRRVQVRAGRDAVDRLNELEWVQGWVLANVWLTDRVAVIDPADGQVRGRLDLDGLLTPVERRRADVTNGLAWHAPTHTLWVSGKNWPWMFGLSLQLPPPPAPRVP